MLILETFSFPEKREAAQKILRVQHRDVGSDNPAECSGHQHIYRVLVVSVHVSALAGYQSTAVLRLPCYYK